MISITRKTRCALWKTFQKENRNLSRMNASPCIVNYPACERVSQTGQFSIQTTTRCKIPLKKTAMQYVGDLTKIVFLLVFLLCFLGVERGWLKAMLER